MKTRACLAIAFVALFPSNDLCARQDAPKKPVIRAGQPFEVPLTVKGTTERVRVRVRNLTPDIVSVVGGDDQYVVSSGGENNIVTIHVVGVSPGESSFKMDVDRAEPDAVFRRELRRVAEQTKKRAETLETVQLPSGDAYRLEDVVDVLQKADRDLHGVLFEREWAAFRDALDDYVMSLIRRANEEANEVPESSLASDARAVVVSYRLVAEKRAVEKKRAWSILSEFIDLLFGTAEKGSNREVCVLTSPPGFDITLAPRSDSSSARTVNGPSLLTIRVGAYKYQIVLEDKTIGSSGQVDFLRNPYVTIECPARDSHACRYRQEPAKPCPPR